MKTVVFSTFALLAAKVSCEEADPLVELLKGMEQRMDHLEDAMGHVQNVLKVHVEGYIREANERLDQIENSCKVQEEKWSAPASNGTCQTLDGLSSKAKNDGAVPRPLTEIKPFSNCQS